MMAFVKFEGFDAYMVSATELEQLTKDGQSNLEHIQRWMEACPVCNSVMVKSICNRQLCLKCDAKELGLID